MLLSRLQVSPDGLPMRLAKLVGHQHRHFATHHLGNWISEYPFRRLVDKENGTSFVYCNDAVRRSLRDDPEELSRLKGIPSGINRSCDFGFPWFRHGRLIPGPSHRRRCASAQLGEGLNHDQWLIPTNVAYELVVKCRSSRKLPKSEISGSPSWLTLFPLSEPSLPPVVEWERLCNQQFL